MSFDAHANFAYSTVATAPSPASSGTSLVVQSGDGSKFPAAPFNATVWPANSQPTTANAEIVRVTVKSTDTLTITRAQESSSARSIGTGDQIAATITAKTLTDVENATMVKLFDSTLAVDTATLDTGSNGIPSGYNALLIYALLRTDDASNTVTTPVLRFNGDSGSNYDTVGLQGNWTSSPATSSAVAQTGINLIAHGSAGGASYAAFVQIRVAFYAETNFFKTAEAYFFMDDNIGSNSWVVDRGITWRSTSAINQITLTAASTTKFKAGSRLLIYGIP